MTHQMTWFEVSRDLKPGDRVVFCTDWDIFPCALVPEGTQATVIEQGLNEIWATLSVKPDDADLQTALKEWDGHVYLAPPLDRNTGNREAAWHEPSPLARV